MHWKFRRILQNLHCTDSEEANASGKDDPDNPNYDKIHKIRKIIELSTEAFRKAMHPGRYLTLDEAVLVMFKLSQHVYSCTTIFFVDGQV